MLESFARACVQYVRGCCLPSPPQRVMLLRSPLIYGTNLCEVHESVCILDNCGSISIASISRMSTTVAPKLSLLGEFQSLLKLITDGDPLTCHSRTQKNERCKSRVGRVAKKRLLALSSDVIECLKNGLDGIEVLLQEASSLVMCIANHQLQAIAKYENWMGMIPLTTDGSSLDDAETKVSISKL